MGETRGGGVGYAVGQEEQYSLDSSLVFVTAGWLLKKISSDPTYFKKCSRITIL